jgi:hypothetical protein
MPHKELLLDTNSYLRLAKSIRPLLGEPFGKDNYALYIHKELQYELDRSQRLQSTFYWIEEEEYKKERKKIIRIQKSEEQDIDDVYEYIDAYKKGEGMNLSREDMLCIATAYVRKIPLVTDDKQMLITAKDFAVAAYRTIELLKLMEDNEFINHEKVDEIISYLKYINDFPIAFNKLYRSIYGSAPPD